MKAFVAPVHLSSRNRQSIVPSTPVKRLSTTSHTYTPGGRRVPCMISPITVTTELATVSLLAYAAYYVFSVQSRQEQAETQLPQSVVDGGSTASPPKKDEPVASFEPSYFTVAPAIATESKPPSTSSFTRRDVSAPPPQVTIPQSNEIISVGAKLPTSSFDNITNPNLSAETISPDVINRQLKWATEQLVDIDDCVAAAIVDTENSSNIILASHGDQDALSSIIKQVDQRNTIPVPKVSQLKMNNLPPSQSPNQPNTVKSIAYKPIGESKLTIVMLSSLYDFLGVKDKRYIDNISEKLNNIVS